MLNDAARAALRDAGISQAAWIRAHGYTDGRWGGDACGCPDDRCKDGYHHYPDGECGCLRVLLDGLLEVRLSGSVYAAAVVAEILRAHKSVEVLSGPDELGDGRQALMLRVMSPERVLAALSASREPAEDALLLNALHPDRDDEAMAGRKAEAAPVAPCARPEAHGFQPGGKAVQCDQAGHRYPRPHGGGRYQEMAQRAIDEQLAAEVVHEPELPSAARVAALEARLEGLTLLPAPCGSYEPAETYGPCETCGRSRLAHARNELPGDDNGGTL